MGSKLEGQKYPMIKILSSICISGSLESIPGMQTHGLTMSGFETLQVGVFGELLPGACLAKSFDGLGIGNLYGERQPSMQGYLRVKQRYRLSR